MPNWTAEYAALSAADKDGGLSPEELERLSVAAFLTGHEDEVHALRERAYGLYLEQGLLDRAAECGFWLIFHQDVRGEFAQAAGWAAQVRRLIPEGAQTGMAALLRQRE